MSLVKLLSPAPWWGHLMEAILWAAKPRRCWAGPGSMPGLSRHQMQKKVTFLQLTFSLFLLVGWGDVGILEGGGHLKQWSLGWSRLSFFFPNNLTLAKTAWSVSAGLFKARSRVASDSSRRPSALPLQLVLGMQAGSRCLTCVCK